MANIGVRSPYFISATQAGGVSAKLTLTIGGSNIYYIVKDSGTSFLVDISEIVRDFVEPTYTSGVTNSSAGGVSVSTSIQFYDTANATGSTVGTPHTESHTAYDAYAYFEDGNNYQITASPLLSNTTLWYPKNVGGSFYSTPTSKTSISSVATSVGGVTIKRYDCSKFDWVRIGFINRFGVPQDIFFFAKTVESVSVQGESYKNVVLNSSGSYTTTKHQNKSLFKQGKTKYRLNTGFISEDYNEFIQELLLSEQVWMTISGDVVRPVQVLDADKVFKTSLNDRLVDYSIEVEQANDLISSMR